MRQNSREKEKAEIVSFVFDLCLLVKCCFTLFLFSLVKPDKLKGLYHAKSTF